MAPYATARNLDEAVSPEVRSFFHPESKTISYVVKDPTSHHAVLIDPVLDYDAHAARVSTGFADGILGYVHEQKLEIDWILETHAHADHLSAAHYLKERLKAPVAISRQIRSVQKTFSKLLNLGDDFPVNGSQFDRLLDEGDYLEAGNMSISVMDTPGHTPACVTYLIGDVAFVGDALSAPEQGTSRTDFPGGDAQTLYKSLQRILALPDETRLFICHDYLSAGKKPGRIESTVGEQRHANIHANKRVSESEFVAMREAHDANLQAHQNILPSIQVNIRAGQLPPAEENGVAYLKVPLNVLR